VPNADKMERKDSPYARSVEESADLGLASVDIPEAYGGLEWTR